VPEVGVTVGQIVDILRAFAFLALILQTVRAEYGR
jgi:hypothetical protein